MLYKRAWPDWDKMAQLKLRNPTMSWFVNCLQNKQIIAITFEIALEYLILYLYLSRPNLEFFFFLEKKLQFGFEFFF